MKRLICVSSFLLMAMLAGCGTASSNAPVTFHATVLETHYNYLLVEPERDSAEYTTSDEIIVGLRYMSSQRWERLLDRIQVSDTVEIAYDGKIQVDETAQIFAYDITPVYAPMEDLRW